MASSFINVCRFNPTLGGTTDWTYSSAVTGYQSPTAAGAGNGVIYSYRAESADLSQWEVGFGAYNSGTGVFARTTVLFNSAGTTAKINFSTVPQVAIVALAEDLVFREKLIAARTYYVRTDGSDSNNGLANTAGGAFLTIAKALAVASSIDCADQQLTVSVQAGTWIVPVVLPRMLASVAPILTGAGATTIISMSGSATGVANVGGTPWNVNNMKLTGGSTGLNVNAGGIIYHSGLEFGAITNYQMLTQGGGSILSRGAYTISGGAQYHVVSSCGYTELGHAVTLTGTPAFSGAFAFAGSVGYLWAYPFSVASGAATGPRYLASANGVIFTGGGGASFFPGNSAGSTTTGGQYL